MASRVATFRRSRRPSSAGMLTAGLYQNHSEVRRVANSEPFCTSGRVLASIDTVRPLTRARRRRTPQHTPGDAMTRRRASRPGGDAASSPPPGTGSIRVALVGVMLAMLLGMLDNTIVGTSMPTVVHDLGGASQLSWVVSAYTLATAMSTPVWGKLGDLFDRKRVFLVSIVLFLLGSAVTGLAQNMTELISFRALQGLGAGGIATGAFAIIGTLVPPRERGAYQSMLASLMAVGIVGGPLLGGVLTDHLGWRWAFYINLPLGAAALAWTIALTHLPRTPARVGQVRIDWLGIALMAVTTCSLVLGLTWGGSRYAWGSVQILGCGALFAVFLIAFLVWERGCQEPLLPLGIFAVRNFSLASWMIFTSGAALFGATLYLPLYQQTVQHATASSSGILLLPLMLPIPAASMIAGRVMAATGKYKIFAVVGAASLATGLALLGTMSPETGRLWTVAYMLLAGTGLGFVMQMPNTIAQN